MKQGGYVLAEMIHLTILKHYYAIKPPLIIIVGVFFVCVNRKRTLSKPRKFIIFTTTKN